MSFISLAVIWTILTTCWNYIKSIGSYIRSSEEERQVILDKSEGDTAAQFQSKCVNRALQYYWENKT